MPKSDLVIIKSVLYVYAYISNGEFYKTEVYL